jgi:cytochrome c556
LLPFDLAVFLAAQLRPPRNNGAAAVLVAAGGEGGDCAEMPVNRGENSQMIRTVSAALTVAALALGLASALAQQDPIAARKQLMKDNGAAAKAGADMVKGEKPFDLAAAQKIFTTFADAAAKAPALFPDNSKPPEGFPANDDFKAGPKIWEDMADFKARFVKFGDDAKAAQASVKDLDSFKAAFGNIGKNDCGGCHETYRLKKS